MSRVPEQLDLALVGRLRRVVGGQVATETELRELAEEADGWVRATEGQLLAEIATEVRRVEALARELAEARRLVAGLEQRTRELRTAWLKHHAEGGSPFAPK